MASIKGFKEAYYEFLKNILDTIILGQNFMNIVYGIKTKLVNTHLKTPVIRESRASHLRTKKIMPSNPSHLTIITTKS